MMIVVKRIRVFTSDGFLNINLDLLSSF